jgi:hypothetical protein
LIYHSMTGRRGMQCARLCTAGTGGTGAQGGAGSGGGGRMKLTGAAFECGMDLVEGSCDDV